MTRQAAVRLIEEAIVAVDSVLAGGDDAGYPGIATVKRTLSEMLQHLVNRSAASVAASGVCKHVVDQWPFNQVGEKVLAASRAFDATFGSGS